MPGPARLFLLMLLLLAPSAAAMAGDEPASSEGPRARVEALLEAGQAARARDALAPLIAAARREDHNDALDALLALHVRVSVALEDEAGEEAARRERLQLAIASADVDRLLQHAKALFGFLQRTQRLEDLPAAYAQARRGLPADAGVVPTLHLRDHYARTWLNAGHPREVRALLQEGLQVAQTHGETAWVGKLHARLGRVYQELGEYAAAREHFEEALAIARTRKDMYEIGRAESLLGFVALGTRDHVEAGARLERALTIWRAHGPPVNAGRGLLNLSAAYVELGRAAEARGLLEEAIRILEAEGDTTNAGRAHSALGDTYEREGRLDEAAREYERALAVAQRTGDLTSAMSLHVGLARLRRRAGEPESGRAFLEAARAASRRIGGWMFELIVLEEQARNALARGRPDEAEQLAASTIAWLAQSARGHGDRDAATVRTRFEGLFSTGTAAAVSQGHVDQAFAFLESGRALLIREALVGGREARRALVTPELAEQERRAREVERRAHERWVVAHRRGVLAAAQAARAKLRAARADLDAVIARMRREHRAAAGVLYPETASLEQVRRRVPAGTAVVVYGALSEGHPCVALVVRRTGARAVRLAERSVLRPVCRALREACRNPQGAYAEALAHAREALVAPLGLGPKDRRVLVSPADAMADVPWSLLWADRRVAVVPSATTWLALSSVRYEDARGVLGLGRPDYTVEAGAAARRDFRERGGAELIDLPASQAEVEQIADVRLLRRDATEDALGRALASRPAWRAVHLACHGLLDAEAPMRSRLALTASATDDGFLTGGEVLRLPWKADLVSLSACRSGRGRAVWGEGMLGLAQAFMISGARSVLCSLWGVDDEATQALMVRFYELWRPRDGRAPLAAAAALRQAQAFVRSQERWAHPYYWAAWILWGPGD